MERGARGAASAESPAPGARGGPGALARGGASASAGDAVHAAHLRALPADAQLDPRPRPARGVPLSGGGQHPRGDHVRARGSGAPGRRARVGRNADRAHAGHLRQARAALHAPAATHRARQRGGVQHVRQRAAPNVLDRPDKRHGELGQQRQRHALPRRQRGPGVVQTAMRRREPLDVGDRVARPRARDETQPTLWVWPNPVPAVRAAPRTADAQQLHAQRDLQEHQGHGRALLLHRDGARSPHASRQPPLAPRGRRRGLRRRRAVPVSVRDHPPGARPVRGEPHGIAALLSAGAAPARVGLRNARRLAHGLHLHVAPRQLDRGPRRHAHVSARAKTKTALLELHLFKS